MTTLLRLTFTALALCLSSCSKEPASSTPTADAPIKDPNGYYKLVSDAAITKPPAANISIGKGQPVEIHYDGSKGDGLSYQLYYADESGSVHPMSGGTFIDKGAGVFSADIKVFNSSADKRPGFMEVITVSGAGINANGQITGKNVTLGMYPVRMEVTE